MIKILHLHIKRTSSLARLQFLQWLNGRYNNLSVFALIAQISLSNNDFFFRNQKILTLCYCNRKITIPNREVNWTIIRIIRRLFMENRMDSPIFSNPRNYWRINKVNTACKLMWETETNSEPWKISNMERFTKNAKTQLRCLVRFWIPSVKYLD